MEDLHRVQNPRSFSAKLLNRPVADQVTGDLIGIGPAVRLAGKVGGSLGNPASRQSANALFCIVWAATKRIGKGRYFPAEPFLKLSFGSCYLIPLLRLQRETREAGMGHRMGADGDPSASGKQT
jgi:hypothetical protein